MLVMVVVVMIFMVVIKGDGLDALGRHHPEAVEVRCTHETIEPALEFQSVDEQNLGLAYRARGGRGGLVDVRVPVGANKCGHGHMLAAHAFHHVAQDREGRNHGNGLISLGSQRAGQRQRECSGRGAEEGSAGRHEGSFQASKWRRGKACATRPPAGPKTSDTP